jgi:HK97 family phage major capsid protein
MMEQEIKSAIEAQLTAWEQFKKANDERLAQLEKKGHAAEDAVAKVDVINEDLNKLAKELAEARLAAQRPAGGDKGELTAQQREHKQAFEQFLRNGDDSGLRAIERKAMNSTSDPDGGYLVLPELEREIDRVVPTISAMSRLARNITIGTRSWQKRVKTSGMAMRRVAEGATGGETTEPKYARIEVVVHPAEVEPWVYNETLEDADIDLAADLAFEASIGFAEGSASEFISGNGVGCAQGITAYTNVANASYAWGKIGYIASGKAATFASVAPADKIVDLQHALKAQYRNGAVWVTSDTVLGKMRQLKDGSGTYYLWQPDPSAGFGGRFLGSPVETDDNMPALASNAYSLAYGNFMRGYAIVNRTGITLIRDNITSKGQTKFNFRKRFGGGVYNFEAIKLLKMAAS